MTLPGIPPGYVRGPMLEAHRQKLIAAHHKRLGIPLGYCRIYGMLFEDWARAELSALGFRLKKKYGLRTARAVLGIIYGRMLEMRTPQPKKKAKS